MASEFKERTTMPKYEDPYYTTIKYGGYSTAIERYLYSKDGTKTSKIWNGCTLPNCTGYAMGRYNEILGFKSGKTWDFIHNACTFYDTAIKNNITVGQTPALGAIMCWGKNEALGNYYGHVAVVERVVSDSVIWISQSDYYATTRESSFSFKEIRRTNGENIWGKNRKKFPFLGFIYCGAYKPSSYTIAPETANDAIEEKLKVKDYVSQKNEKTVREYAAKQINTRLLSSRGIDLLSSTSLVESPFIILKVGKYTFGSYTKSGTLERSNFNTTVTFPNCMQSIKVNKVNGAFNQYDISMIYQIAPGDDPNLLDKIFGTVSDTRKVTISYGDWCSHPFVYRDEEAIITKMTSRVEFSSQSITYNLTCQSTSLPQGSQSYYFEAKANVKGSKVLRELIESTKYSLTLTFKAMSSSTFISENNLIPDDDTEITLEAQNMTLIDYLNYVIGSMKPRTTSSSGNLANSTYHMLIDSDASGLYFKVVRVGVKDRELYSASDVYEIDIGYPTTALVTSFSLDKDDSWALLYKCSDEISLNNYQYRIDDDGKLYTEFTGNNFLVDPFYNYRTNTAESWWANMTEFPISATLVIKGLLRPMILMRYLRVNTYFYGQKHTSSGLYIVKKQEDRIDSSGYRTTLSLTRVSGDVDRTASNTINYVEDRRTDQQKAEDMKYYMNTYLGVDYK